VRLKTFIVLLGICLSFPVLAAHAQDAVGDVARPAAAVDDQQMHGRLVLLLPFENRSDQPNLDWIGEAFPDIFSRRLTSADFLPLGREDRLYAFDHLGLPQNLQPSRAMTIRVAQLLDADYVIIGSYTIVDHRLTATARVLDMAALTLSRPIELQSDLSNLLDTINGLAWQVVRQMDPQYAVAEQTFLVADGKLPPDAFENYIRGLIAETLSDRIRHLKEAIRLDPDFVPAWLQLGLAYFADQDYDLAATTLGHLPKDDQHATEADFYRGLAFFYVGDYMKAEDAFAFVSTRIPLPEVLNNQGVAASRRGKPSVPLFQQAIAADPKDPDYRFNLAVSLARQHDTAGALKEIEEELKLRPTDTEAQAFEQRLKNPPPPNPDPGQAVADTDEPLERIKRTYDGAGVRQAAFELEQVQQMRLASMPAPERAAELVKDGDQFFGRGLILEAEREYQAALAADSKSALAHAGLAAVRERSGDDDAARKEAQLSLSLHPNVPAHLLLARMDLASNQIDAAAGQVGAALKLDPSSPGALGMRQALEARGEQVP
jgi:tetratricopeptide (TPR) repeat protein